MLEILAPCVGVLEPLAPRQMTFINYNGRFLTSGAYPSCLLTFLGLADTVISPNVFCHIYWLPAEKDQLSDGYSVRELFYVVSTICFISHVPFPFHENWGTEVTTHRTLYG
jgi:hypothetical protein